MIAGCSVKAVYLTCLKGGMQMDTTCWEIVDIQLRDCCSPPTWHHIMEQKKATTEVTKSHELLWRDLLDNSRKACCVLHNICKERAIPIKGDDDSDDEDDNADDQLAQGVQLPPNGHDFHAGAAVTAAVVVSVVAATTSRTVDN
ncbi:hypothetical protein MAR_033363, partial [Mya arenaria]